MDKKLDIALSLTTQWRNQYPLQERKLTIAHRHSNYFFILYHPDFSLHQLRERLNEKQPMYEALRIVVAKLRIMGFTVIEWPDQ